MRRAQRRQPSSVDIRASALPMSGTSAAESAGQRVPPTSSASRRGSVDERVGGDGVEAMARVAHERVQCVRRRLRGDHPALAIL